MLKKNLSLTLLGLSLAGCSDYNFHDRTDSFSNGEFDDEGDADLDIPFIDGVMTYPSQSDDSLDENNTSVPDCYFAETPCLGIDYFAQADGRYHEDISAFEIGGRMPLTVGELFDRSAASTFTGDSCVSSLESALTACFVELEGTPYVAFSEGNSSDSEVYFGVPFTGNTSVFGIYALDEDVFVISYVRGSSGEGMDIPYDSALFVNVSLVLDNPSDSLENPNNAFRKRMGRVWYEGDSSDDTLMNEIAGTWGMPDDGTDYRKAAMSLELRSGIYFQSVGLVPDRAWDKEYLTLGTGDDQIVNIGGLDTRDFPETSNLISIDSWYD